MLGITEIRPETDAVFGEWGRDETDVDDDEFDEVFDVLKNQRRRMVLDYLADHPSTTRSELAEHLAAYENDVPLGELTSAQRKRVYVALHQNHLPKLAEYDVISYDTDRGTVVRTDRTERFLRCLRALESNGTASAETRTGTRTRRLGSAALLTGALGVAVLSGNGPTIANPVFVLILLLFGTGWALVVRGFED